VTTTFSDLGVDAGICARLESRGIAAPFPVQAATIPASLEGRDVVAKAPTGSGKTLAFGVAAIESIRDSSPRRPRGLILEPTRELAAQVRDELGSIMEGGTRRIIAIYGGTRYGPAQAALNKGVDILVACPGRLEDLIEQGMVDLSEVCFFLPTIFLLVGRWSPARARKEREEHERAIEDERRKLEESTLEPTG